MTAAIDTMTRTQLETVALATPVEYKEGWTLNFSNDGPDGLVAHLSAFVPDSRRPRWVTFNDYWPVPQDISSQSDLYNWLLRKFDEIERHETREFYKVDGILWDDPHTPDKPPFLRQGF